MAIEALLQHPSHQWKTWIEENLERRELIILDPGCAIYHAPCMISRMSECQVIDWRFIGTSEAAHSPLALIRGAKNLLDSVSRDAVVLMPNYKSSPVNHEIYETLFCLFSPERLLIPSGVNPGRNSWPTCVEIPLNAPMEVVFSTQRRARWIELIEGQEVHELLLHEVHFSESRLGLGDKILLESASFPASVVWAERHGDSLFVICDKNESLENFEQARKKLGLKKVVVAQSADYSGLLVGLYRHQSEPIAMGIIQKTDFRNGKILIKSKIAPGTKIARIQLGLLRLDSVGKELGELRPWTV